MNSVQEEAIDPILYSIVVPDHGVCVFFFFISVGHTYDIYVCGFILCLFCVCDKVLRFF